MKKRMSAILLSALLIIPFILSFGASALSGIDNIADVDNDGIVSAKDSAIVARHVAGWTAYMDSYGNISFPQAMKKITAFSTDAKVDFKGREFRFISQSNSNQHLAIHEITPIGVESSDFTKMKETDTKKTNNFALESKAVYNRNKYLEEKYNCKITCDYVASPYDVITAEMLAGTGQYDMGLIYLSNMNYLAGVNAFEDISSISTVNLSADYFNQKLNDGITIGNKTFMAFGDADTVALRGSSALVANSTFIQEYTGIDIAQLVLSGKWTLDKLYEISSAVYSQGKAEGKAVYGFCAETDAPSTLFNSAGGSLTYRDSDNLVRYKEKEEDITEITTVLQKMKQCLVGEFRCVGDRNTKNSEGKNAYVDKFAFQLMNIGHNSYGYIESKNAIALIPAPKYDENQTSYITPLKKGSACGYVIFKNSKNNEDAKNYGFRNGMEMEGFFLSAFFEASKNQTGAAYSLIGSLTEEIMSRSAYSKVSSNRQLMDTIYDSLTVSFDTVLNYRSIGELIDKYCTPTNYGNLDSAIKTYKNAISSHGGMMLADQRNYAEN